MSAAVEIRGCRMRRGRGRDAVEFRLDALDVARDEQVAVRGPSGCGKSTLLEIIAGLRRPRAGRVVVCGQDLGRLRPARLDAFRGRHIGFVHQSHHLLEGFTALENVRLGLRFGRAVPAGSQRESASAALERAGVGALGRKRPDELSAGERQRVAVARAIASGPDVLLADEPTASLDPESAAAIFELITGACRESGCALLFVTHDAELAARLPRELDARGLIARAEPEVGSAES